ncbi:MAG: gliding motility lipoprotein GldH [Cyclobacteriaceae bacterium]|nr:gliding motility lipoprotein GldH [Cyclobacteriaceae bacterium]
MRNLIMFYACMLALSACDETRLYEKNEDFKNRYWLAADQPTFEFDVDDKGTYNLYFTIRNESDYPNSNIYFTYHLTDSAGNTLEKKLTNQFLFDKKTGRPFGSTGLGYVYEHQFSMLENYSFKNPGTYTMRFEQFMRTDTLRGVLSVGLRVEKSQNSN